MVTKIRDSYLKPQNYSLGASCLWSFSLGILHGAWWPTCNRNMFLEPMVKCGLLRTLSIWSHSFQVSALIPWTMLLKSSRSSGMLCVHNFLLPSTRQRQLSTCLCSLPCSPCTLWITLRRLPAVLIGFMICFVYWSPSSWITLLGSPASLWILYYESWRCLRCFYDSQLQLIFLKLQRAIGRCKNQKSGQKSLDLIRKQLGTLVPAAACKMFHRSSYVKTYLALMPVHSKGQWEKKMFYPLCSTGSSGEREMSHMHS